MIYSPESFFSTTLASAVTATQTTIPLTAAPTNTSGYMVLEANSSNREIILYTGVTSTTLTGVTRGLAFYGSDNSGGTGIAHAAGTDVANRDVHYYFAQYYDFLMGTSATGANSMAIGDGNTISASDRLWYVRTSSLSAFWGLNSSGQMVVSEDGTTSYVISAGGSGVTAGDGISITAGAVAVDYLSASGLSLSGSKLTINAGQGLSTTSASELYVDLTHDFTWEGQNTFSTSSTFNATAYLSATTFNGNASFLGAVSGIQKYTIGYLSAGENLVTGDAVAIGDSVGVSTQGNTSYSTVVTANSTTWFSQKFTTSERCISIPRIDLRINQSLANNLTVVLRADSGGKPTGTNLGIGAADSDSDLGSGVRAVYWSTPVPLSPSTNYHIIVYRASPQDVEWNINASGSLFNRSLNSGTDWSAFADATGYYKLYEIQGLVNKVYKTDATDNNCLANNFIGFAEENISSGDTGNICIGGIFQGLSALSCGYTYYLGDTAGQIQTTAGTETKKVGVAVSADKILIKHDN